MKPWYRFVSLLVDEDCQNYNTANNKNVDKLIEILR